MLNLYRSSFIFELNNLSLEKVESAIANTGELGIVAAICVQF